MKMKDYKQEQAQSLVLVALMAVVLVAFVGLAVDGGNIYAQRRVAQNAADGAAVSGAQLASDENWRFGPDPLARRLKMLQFIHRIAEIHGIPDSNDFPEDGINANVSAYYTNRNGEPYTTCTIETCTTIPAETLGVQVFVTYEFPTYFAGVIGWNDMTVQSNATGLARVGAEGYLGNKWAVFGIDKQSCPNTEVDIQGAFTNKVRGNAHSNGGMTFQGPEHQGGQNVRLTYVPPNPYSSSTYTGYPSADIGLVLPEFADYYNLARTQALAGHGHLHNNLPIPPGYTRPTYLTNNTINSIGWDQASGTYPYTWIDGDLVISRTDTVNVFLGGLIAVNGNVIVQAPQIQGRADGFTLIATGSITFDTTNTKFAGKAYEDRAPFEFDPLLYEKTNVTVVWSNADFDESGGNSCVDPALNFLGRGYQLVGAVLAPHGRAVLNNGGGSKLINGTLIADTIAVSGANTLLWYSGAYFPPQPDYVELIE